MRVLLTGGNGFVGSHILDLLRSSGHEITLLTRPGSDMGFIRRHLDRVDHHAGTLGAVASLKAALRGVDAVIHCAGKTKVVRPHEYDQVNREGTRNLVEAVNAHRNARHFVLISSLAVSGPGTLEQPAHENDPPHPVSAYGRSKLAAEELVRKGCGSDWTILRPAAVYGPRDRDFLAIYRTVKRRLIPLIDGGRRPFSLVFAPDVAAAVLRCLDRPQAFGKIYHVAAAPPCSNEELVREIAARMGVRGVRMFIPGALLYPAAWMQEIGSRVTGRPNILSRDKLKEIRAPGWVCAAERIQQDLGFEFSTPLEEGVARTLEWYCRQGWV